MPITTGHLCCGAGGDILGVKAAGATPLWAVDKNDDAIGTVRINHPDIQFTLTGDIRQIDFTDKRFKADVVISGIPCQPFTPIGRRLKEKDERDVSLTVVSAIKSISPKGVIFENVRDYRNSAGFALLNKELSNYNIEWRVINVADYGVPQKRQRLIGIGCKSGPPMFPEPTHAEHPGLFEQKIEWVRFGAIKDGQIMKPLSAKALRGTLRRLRNHSDAGRGFAVQIIDAGDMMFTVLGVMYRGSGTSSHATLIWDDGKVRNVSFTEARRAQGFPDTYVFCGKSRSQWQQVANAIPPVVAERLIKGFNAKLD